MDMLGYKISTYLCNKKLTALLLKAYLIVNFRYIHLRSIYETNLEFSFGQTYLAFNAAATKLYVSFSK